MKTRAVLIDLDGTLLDTVADIAAAVNAMRVDLGLESLAEEEIRDYVGKGSEVLVHRALTRDPEGRVEEARFGEAYPRFMHHYEVLNGVHARLYPGVREGLDAMRADGLALACVTNKPGQFTRPLLARAGLLDDFAIVVSGDTLPQKKPHPAPMLHACAAMGVAPADAVAIGDSVNDALAARAAGCRVFGVPYGYNEGLPVQSLDLDAIVGSLHEAALLIRNGTADAPSH